MRVEPATILDVARITEIYNHAVEHTTATFDTQPKSIDDRKTWFEQLKTTNRHPVLVVKVGHRVVGWASISPWSDRCAYEDTGEITIYIDHAHQGQGLGKALLSRLLKEAKLLNYYTLIARIAGESNASVRLHESFGFKKIGTMEKVGYKFGKRLDVRIYQVFLETITLQ